MFTSPPTPASPPLLLNTPFKKLGTIQHFNPLLCMYIYYIIYVCTYVCTYVRMYVLQYGRHGIGTYSMCIVWAVCTVFTVYTICTICTYSHMYL